LRKRGARGSLEIFCHCGESKGCSLRKKRTGEGSADGHETFEARMVLADATISQRGGKTGCMRGRNMGVFKEPGISSSPRAAQEAAIRQWKKGRKRSARQGAAAKKLSADKDLYYVCFSDSHREGWRTEKKGERGKRRSAPPCQPMPWESLGTKIIEGKKQSVKEKSNEPRESTCRDESEQCEHGDGATMMYENTNRQKLRKSSSNVRRPRECTK